MKFISFSEEDCVNCYRCIRACNTKAISVFGDPRENDEKLCISCGECYVACERNGLTIKDKVKEVKDALSSNKKVIASLAPSFPGAFSIKEGGKIVTALKELGFYAVEETAVGADVVINAYENFTNDAKQKNLISTSCPSTVYLVEKYYPELVNYLIPVVSPMIAHGKMIREKYGEDAYIVFIGPCIAKKVEAHESQYNGIINSVLTFVELQKWFKDNNLDLKNQSPEPFDEKANDKGKLIPCNIKLSNEKNENYEKIVVTGVERSKEILNSLKKGELSGIFLEILSCPGGCIDGTGMLKEAPSYYVRKKYVKDYIAKKCSDDVKIENKFAQKIDIERHVSSKKVKKYRHPKEQIDEVLNSIGKNKKEDELNCNACGYVTCREFAESILRKNAHVNMCHPFMRSKAESLKNVIFDHSPNAIFMVDFNLVVREFNPSSEQIFNIEANKIKGKRIGEIIEEDTFKKVLETKTNLIGKKVEYSNYGVILIANIIYLKEEKVLMAIMTDVTSAEKNKEELVRVKKNTIDVAQSVIDKQMRVAQEIASLLGETTAETKVALTDLKDIVIEERRDD
ncbi:[Fe-Fe] hydrogenase large subunit C-terminal domain-containing protein [Natranaerobius thermophilus]|uniref:Putative PAS/PAC sensor protein n=1 Tax=Natranaerobius thermophilus (strain ATCC BAA-1301 / DSM 18059 / JW/NM-WN-LF) TaxID=457570 RepID=B2A858_NATTJ|nr:[Fe-Fe] hydrogenase large subunit C-terminal domain-containing protein [Natranaerobius thermophilus]ACB84424.1 putative PAS/PAC sensor protein [Natranaerobius thermophilus JW/NM-WN-LF]